MKVDNEDILIISLLFLVREIYKVEIDLPSLIRIRTIMAVSLTFCDGPDRFTRFSLPGIKTEE